MKKPQRMDRLAYKTIGAETIILDTKIGQEVHQLNEVATFVWNLCDGTHTLEAIVKEVCETFDTNTTQATQDVEELIVMFSSKSLLID